MARGESVVALERRTRWWRSRRAVLAAALVALAGAGFGAWRATRSDAGWHAVPIRQAPGAGGSGLTAVTVLPDGTAWAAGFVVFTPSGDSHTAVQRWDGHQWTEVPTPALGKQIDSFNGVAASSDSDVWAVGDTTTDPAAQGSPASGYTDSTLIEHWDGTRWTALGVAERPRLASGDAILNAVAAVDRADAWAVGRVANTALIEHWDGTRWSVPPSPDLHSDMPDRKSADSGGRLSGVAAGSDSDVWAVGENWSGGRDGCLIEHYDGAGWSVVACPAPSGASGAALLSVAAMSPRDLWAVGWYTTGSGDLQPAHALIEHFDGTGWRVVPSPSVALGSGRVSQTSDELTAVAGRSADDIYAASGDGVLIHWDGSHWTRSATKLPGVLFGMAATAGGDIWEVGSEETPFPDWLANVEKP